MNFKKLKTRLGIAFLGGLSLLFCLAGKVHASTGMDASAITEYLPIILELAIFGMLIGMFKKFGSSGR